MVDQKVTVKILARTVAEISASHPPGFIEVKGAPVFSLLAPIHGVVVVVVSACANIDMYIMCRPLWFVVSPDHEQPSGRCASRISQKPSFACSWRAKEKGKKKKLNFPRGTGFYVCSSLPLPMTA